jgi:hypothetical protein
MNGLKIKSTKRRTKMKTITTVLKKGIILAASIFILFNMNAFSYVLNNGSGTAYTEGTSEGIGISNISIEMLIIEGSGYFLKSKADIQSFLNSIEWQDTREINYIALNQVIKNALTNIIQARSAFEELIGVAEATPYNLEVIERLKYFDYDYFMKEYNLNPYVFNIVKEYLMNGDITGTFKYSNDKLKEIEQAILKIQEEISANQLPEVSICWRLNELCAETTLFGSYIARIFKTIKLEKDDPI